MGSVGPKTEDPKHEGGENQGGLHNEEFNELVIFTRYY
jgi:hypothetical protein